MRFLLALLFATGLGASEPLPYHPSQRGFHDATLELARHCQAANLHSEARKLAGAAAEALPEAAAEVLKASAKKPDVYTAKAWGAYLDRRESVQQRRALGAAEAGLEARQVLLIDPDHADSRTKIGHKLLPAMGWLSIAEHERLSPLVINQFPAAAPRVATWAQPYVLTGRHFTLVTDLPWARAVRYVGLLDQFHAAYFERLGDVIPRREQPNVVWCCARAADFVALSESMGFPMTATNGGLHVGSLGAVLINAERCDEVGRRNKSRDNLARTLFHECAHRLTEIGLRGRAANHWELARTTEHAWIVESIAITFEDLHFEGNKAVLTGLEDQRKYTIDKHWKGKTGKPPELAPVLAQGAIDFATDKPLNNAEKYALAGSVGWYCMYEKPASYRAAYLALLVDYYRADTAGRGFDARFGATLPEFEREWRVWVLKQP